MRTWERVHAVAAEHPDWTGVMIADHLGCSAAYVSMLGLGSTRRAPKNRAAREEARSELARQMAASHLERAAKMEIGPWVRDELGNMCREIRGV